MKISLIASGLALTLIGGGFVLSSHSNLGHAFAAVQDQDAANQKEWAKEAKLSTKEAQKEASGRVLETDLDKNDGAVMYDVVIYDGTTVKEVTLNAKTGEIVKVAVDDDAKQKLEQIREDEQDAINQKDWTKEAKLATQEAQALAQKEVQGRVLETDLDKNAGSLVYDVVIYDGKTVKEVTLNANTGKIVKVGIDDDAEQKLENLK
ncbi:Uncharacterized membrane protein YkoI [Bacillus sp. OV166]|uniref:PepSY domain-containing protein n=1 Tax=Bacillus sp. OV166 TaxID=1882763 RepID=UPI000A2ABC6B|nr:PepSY domain-containing protein [Bacillus sp. OV166]SMQ86864.1 Uncharacterized membrane protein YkoI [Bacillus sp. OV166]